MRSKWAVCIQGQAIASYDSLLIVVYSPSHQTPANMSPLMQMAPVSPQQQSAAPQQSPAPQPPQQHTPPQQNTPPLRQHNPVRRAYSVDSKCCSVACRATRVWCHIEVLNIGSINILQLMCVSWTSLKLYCPGDSRIPPEYMHIVDSRCLSHNFMSYS